MRLTGAQIETLAEIADGADVYLVKLDGEERVSVTREEDDLTGYINPDGFFDIYRGEVLPPGQDPRD